MCVCSSLILYTITDVSIIFSFCIILTSIFYRTSFSKGSLMRVQYSKRALGPYCYFDQILKNIYLFYLRIFYGKLKHSYKSLFIERHRENQTRKARIEQNYKNHICKRWNIGTKMSSWCEIANLLDTKLFLHKITLKYAEDQHPSI